MVFESVDNLYVEICTHMFLHRRIDCLRITVLSVTHNHFSALSRAVKNFAPLKNSLCVIRGSIFDYFWITLNAVYTSQNALKFRITEKNCLSQVKIYFHPFPGHCLSYIRSTLCDHVQQAKGTNNVKKKKVNSYFNPTY